MVSSKLVMDNFSLQRQPRLHENLQPWPKHHGTVMTIKRENALRQKKTLNQPLKKRLAMLF